MARNDSHCLVRPAGNSSSGQSWYFHFTARCLWCNVPDLLIGWCFSFTASWHLLLIETVFSVPGRAHWRTLRVLTWPLQSQGIWLQRAQFWCNYTSFQLLMPWKIFTQVSHNHSGTAVDTELHKARHTPAVGYIIFLQRRSGDTSVSSLAHQLMKFGWMKTAVAPHHERFQYHLYKEVHPVIWLS